MVPHENVEQPESYVAPGVKLFRQMRVKLVFYTFHKFFWLFTMNSQFQRQLNNQFHKFLLIFHCRLDENEKNSKENIDRQRRKEKAITFARIMAKCKNEDVPKKQENQSDAANVPFQSSFFN